MSRERAVQNDNINWNSTNVRRHDWESLQHTERTDISPDVYLSPLLSRLMSTRNKLVHNGPGAFYFHYVFHGRWPCAVTSEWILRVHYDWYSQPAISCYWKVFQLILICNTLAMTLCIQGKRWRDVTVYLYSVLPALRTIVLRALLSSKISLCTETHALYPTICSKLLSTNSFLSMAMVLIPCLVILLFKHFHTHYTSSSLSFLSVFD